MHFGGNALPLLCFRLVVGVNLCCAGVLEVLLGPQLGSNADSGFVDSSKVQNLVEGFGYPFETHHVKSQTGYVLSLHRIWNTMKGRKQKDSKRPVALFQHGLLSASDMWLFRGPDNDLVYHLVESGYDVWMSNMRGNVFSMAHETLDPYMDKEYWDFSLHEVAYYDMPAIIDYILNVTKQSSLFFLGHSIGSTVGMMLGSLRPEYNAKIKLHLALAPLVYVKHTISIVHKLIMLPAVPVMEAALRKEIYNVFPRRFYFSTMMQMLCKDGTTLQKLCVFLSFLMVGTDYDQFNTTYLPDMTSYFPAGTSTYLMQHVLQIYLKGIFSALDYGTEKLNLEKYNQKSPPAYNLSAVTHPISLHFGNGDLLVTEKDIHYMEKTLPNCVGVFPVPFPKFNHMDFVWAIDAKKLLYDRLIILMDEFR